MYWFSTGLFVSRCQVETGVPGWKSGTGIVGCAKNKSQLIALESAVSNSLAESQASALIQMVGNAPKARDGINGVVVIVVIAGALL